MKNKSFPAIMICGTQKTLKASPISNRGCIAPPEESRVMECTPKGCPGTLLAAPFFIVWK